MTAAPELSADERARVAAFDAAPQLAESAPMTRAVLALHRRAHPEGPTSCVECNKGRKFVPYPCPTVQAVATVLAADPEPRDAVVEALTWCLSVHQGLDEDEAGAMAEELATCAAAALDASRGGTQ